MLRKKARSWVAGACGFAARTIGWVEKSARKVARNAMNHFMKRSCVWCDVCRFEILDARGGETDGGDCRCGGVVVAMLVPSLPGSGLGLVDVYINYLRGKVDSGYDHPLIRTHSRNWLPNRDERLALLATTWVGKSKRQNR